MSSFLRFVFFFLFFCFVFGGGGVRGGGVVVENGSICVISFKKHMVA
jgi:hypothetical protein